MNLTPTALTTPIREQLDKLTNLDLTKFDVTKLDMPKFDMPKFDTPKFEMPAVDLPIDAGRVVAWVRDAAYVGVGAAVVVGQQVTDRARQLVDAVR